MIDKGNGIAGIVSRRIFLLCACCTWMAISLPLAAKADPPIIDSPVLLPLSNATVQLNASQLFQKVDGLGGNYTRGRDGLFQFSDKAGQDAVGRLTVSQLTPANARIAIPLTTWAPVEGGPYAREDPGVVASFLLLQDMDRRGIPVVASIFNVPDWAAANPADKTSRSILASKYPDLIEAIVQYLLTARDRYGISVENISFNEPDAGNAVKIAPAEMAALIKAAGDRFKQLDIPATWLIGDTASAATLITYATPLVSDPALKNYLGPLAFQSWDVASASDGVYQSLAALAKLSNKTLWCTEVGYDSHLDKANPPVWSAWSHALRLAVAYWRIFALSGASLADGYEYQDDFPLAGGLIDARPYPSFRVIDQLGGVLRSGSQLAAAASNNQNLLALATILGNSKQISVLLINTAGAGTVTVSGLPPRGRLTVTMSDETSQERVDDSHFRASGQGDVSIPLTARSVTTIAVRGR